jgi:hypothetical protein
LKQSSSYLEQQGSLSEVLESRRNLKALFFKKKKSWLLVAHTCNPTYSGGRDQKDQGSQPANSSRDPISKKPITKKGLMEWFKV